VEAPDTLYATVGDSQIAYQVFGDGPPLVYSIGFILSNIDHFWDLPDLARFLRRLGSFARVTMYDRRGMGASDPLPPNGMSSWENWVDDLMAVLEATDTTRTSMLASTDAGAPAMLFAAAYPERVETLTLTNTGARAVSAPDYPYGIPNEMVKTLSDILARDWGKIDGFFPDFAWPPRAKDPEFRRWVSKLQRAVMTPRAAGDLFAMELALDARKALPLIQAPTLLVATSDFPLVPPANLEYLAQHIADSKLILLKGQGAFGYLEDADRYLEALEEHVTGEHKVTEADRVLATVMFTDIVGSTERAAQLGDQRWRGLLDRHDDIAQRELVRFGGRLVKSTGDGVLATFDGPARAVRCARELSDALRSEGIDIRTGIHAGEVELRGNDVGGIAVHIAARVMGLAGPGEVLVSSTVKGLVVGSGLTFDDRGSHGLAGVPDEWQIHALAS
jgi:class 3 adenylate cyclase/alpha-beta hydrolase superfamily lysophospholipase